jgi:zinc transport system substrate-binding protein
MRRAVFWCTMAMALGCGAESDDTSRESVVGDDSRLMVVAVNYPLAYMAERIGGDLIRVEYPVPAGVDPAFWQPTPEEIGRIQGADVILLNGAGYAKWVATATLPASRIIVTSEGAEAQYLVVEGNVSHTHGPEGEHSHGEVAFTTWLDPTIAILQAEAIAGAFARFRPAHAAAFEDSLSTLVADLQVLDDDLTALFDSFATKTFIGSHPVYQYLAARYGVDIPSVHFEPDEEPTEEGWRDLRSVLAGHATSVMLWEAAPLAATEERLKAMGVTVVVFDPAGNRSARGNYVSVMRGNVAALESVRNSLP